MFAFYFSLQTSKGIRTSVRVAMAGNGEDTRYEPRGGDSRYRDTRRDYEDRGDYRGRSRSRSREGRGKRHPDWHRSRDGEGERKRHRDALNRGRSRSRSRGRDEKSARDRVTKRRRSEVIDAAAGFEPNTMAAAPFAVSLPEPGGQEISLDAELSPEEIQMMCSMGIPYGFDSTQGKHVDDEKANAGAVKVKTTRSARQYMNRRGGFNRPLPAEQSGQRVGAD